MTEITAPPQPEPTPAQGMSDRTKLQLLLLIGIIGLFVYLLAPILTPFAVAALLGYLGDPLVDLGYLTALQWLVAVPVFTVLFIFIFDDHTTWFRHRREVWYLTDRRLIYEKSGAEEENAAVPLFAIEWMEPWLWWSLRVGFEGGTSTSIRYIPRPRDARARIEAARARAAPPPREAGHD